MKKKGDGLLKQHLDEFIKEFRQLSRNIIDEIDGGVQKLRSDSKKIKSSKSKKSKKKNNVSFWKTLGVVCFNLLIFIWIWISLLTGLVSLILTGFVIILSGIVILIVSIFGLIRYNNASTRDILFSLLFSGLGVIILGELFSKLFWKITTLFFKGTKKYLELNSRLIKK